MNLHTINTPTAMGDLLTAIRWVNANYWDNNYEFRIATNADSIEERSLGSRRWSRVSFELMSDTVRNYNMNNRRRPHDVRVPPTYDGVQG